MSNPSSLCSLVPGRECNACHLICHPLVDGSSDLRTLPRSSTSRVNHLPPLRIQLQPTPHNVYSPTPTSNELCRIQSLKNNKSIHFNFHKDVSNIFHFGVGNTNTCGVYFVARCRVIDAPASKQPRNTAWYFVFHVYISDHAYRVYRVYCVRSQ